MLKKIALSLCFTLFLGLLSACSPVGSLHLGQTESTPSNNTENIDRTNTPGTIGTPIAIPPRFDNEPLKPGQTGSPVMPNGMPALSPMKGINVDTLFAEKIKNTDERFNRVENAVVDLRKELETYKPAIVRLAAVESDIQNLIKELEVLLQETPTKQPPLGLSGGGGADAETDRTMQNVMSDIQQVEARPAAPPQTSAPPPKPKPAPVLAPPAAPVQQKPPEQSAKHKSGGPVATNFRIGEHGDKIRIAFDTNVETPFTVELDNEEHLILMELPQASWDGKKEQSFPNSALLENLSVEPINGTKGSMVIISLKKDTRILQREHLSPDKTSDYHRVYFDLKL